MKGCKLVDGGKLKCVTEYKSVLNKTDGNPAKPVFKLDTAKPFANRIEKRSGHGQIYANLESEPTSALNDCQVCSTPSHKGRGCFRSGIGKSEHIELDIPGLSYNFFERGQFAPL